MGDLNAFCQKVSSIIRPEWQLIPSPQSEEWKQKFKEDVDRYLETKASSCDYGGAKKKKGASRIAKVDLRSLSQEEDFQLSCQVTAMMEGIWLEGRKKIAAIESCNKNNPLHLDEVVSYARRLRGTTYSPPENMNTHDPTRHYEVFPHYHFLGMPSIAEMHNSRLFALSKMSQHSSAPRIIFEAVSEDMQRMVLECATPGAVIHYQTSRVNPEQINPHTGQPTVYTTAPAVYDSSKKLNFRVTSNKFTVYAWSTCEGLRPSEVVQSEYMPPSTEVAEAPKKSRFSFFLGK
ncbi:hypothetical protein BgAZ_301090 [Babesia gibsoni]|uniref:Uncharacterized protein n=1 Tax=Babesia gibsoni TaxID=33632 RepID=A0AAD8PDT1_BABGI|nr:hypothetical protein BgAZ_301090 [Babesia gibsoni]